MIFLRSIPLSFSVFWRFLVVLPLFLPVAGVLVLVYSLFLPFLAAFFAQIAIAFAMMLALRGAYQARGVSGVSVFGRLFVAALKWGFFEAFVYLLIGFAMALAFWALAVMDLEQIGALLASPEPPALRDLLSASPVVLGIGIVGTGLIYGLSVAFMVPKAAAGYAAGNAAEPLDFFWGFGTGFVSLALVMLAAAAISYLTGAMAGAAELLLHSVAVVSDWATGTEGDQPLPVAALALLAGLVLLQIWTFCWTYAAAAEAFLQRHARIAEARAAERVLPLSDPEELRALRKSRQPT